MRSLRDSINQISSLLKNVAGLLSRAERRQALLLAVLILIVSLLDVFSLASIVPLLWLVFGESFPHLSRLGIPSNLLLPFALLAWVLLFLAKNGLGYWSQLRQNGFAYGLATRLSALQFNHYFRPDHSPLPTGHTAEAVRQIHHVPVEFAAHVLLALLHLFADGLIFTLLLGGLALYQPDMFLLLTLLIVPLAGMFYWHQRGYLRRLGASLHQLAGEALRQLMEALSGWSEIRLYRREKIFREAYLNQQRRLNQTVALFHSLNSLPPRFLEMAAVLAVAVLVFTTHALGYAPQKVVVLLGLFTAATYRLLPSLNRLSSSLMQLQTYRHTVALLKPALVDPPGRRQAGEPVSFRHSLSLQQVSFAYPGRSGVVLHNIHFQVARGETVGIHGPSGSGKTTLLLILLRLLREQQGAFLVDGRPLADQQVPAWQKLIGFVPQQPFLLDGSVLQNIVFHPGARREGIDEEALNFALRAAQLDHWLAHLPDGLETQVGERGARLSGGQRQRIVLARALYRRPQLLILDEATSGLDPETEAHLLAALRELQDVPLTMVIVSHRQKPLEICHRTYQLQGGRLIETDPAVLSSR